MTKINKNDKSFGFNISDFLKKFGLLKNKNLITKVFVVKIIKDLTEVDIKKEDITIRSSNIYIKNNNIIKSEILINKNKILTALKENEETKFISNIL